MSTPNAAKLRDIIAEALWAHVSAYDLAGQVLARQRMDFLMLLPNKARVVIEVDGKQHYADGDRASPGRYAEMVAMAADKSSSAVRS